MLSILNVILQTENQSDDITLLLWGMDVWHSGSGPLPQKTMLGPPGHPASLHKDGLPGPIGDPQSPALRCYTKAILSMHRNQELT